MRLTAALVALALARAAAASPWEKKEWGALVIGGAATSDSGRGTPKMAEALRRKFPVEFVLGLGDAREIQSGIDRLTAQNVRKIVVVPLVLTTESAAMEQTQYVLGLRKEPSEDFFKAPHGHSGYTTSRRVQTKLPVVMSSGLDDHPLVAEILAARAKEVSQHPKREWVFVVGRGGAADAENELTQRHLAALARSVAELGGFAGARAFTVRDDAPEAKTRAQAESALRKAVASLSRSSRVIVVYAYLAPDGLEREVRRILDGTFFAPNTKGLIGDPRLAKWIEAKAREAAAMPNMRRFKDAGRPLEKPDAKRVLRLDTGAPKLRRPSAGNATGPRRTIEPMSDTTSGGP